MMQEVESGTAIIALRARVPCCRCISTARSAFHITHIYYGKPMELDDLYAQGVNNDTAHQLCQRIHDVFYAMRAMRFTQANNAQCAKSACPDCANCRI